MQTNRKMELTEPTPRRWTLAEYERMAAEGIFAPDERLELLYGHIVVKSPQSPLHATGVNLVRDALALSLAGDSHVRVRSPFNVANHSQSEPDLSLLPLPIRAYLTEHPREALLIVEVSDVELELDTGVKASLYALARVPEYWVLDLRRCRIGVHRDPVLWADDSSVWGYRAMRVYDRRDSIDALHAPGHPIAVADLLPPPLP